LASNFPQDDKRWYVNSAGHTMSVLELVDPVDPSLSYNFSLSTKEVTAGQISKYPEHFPKITAPSARDLPATSLHLLQAVAYCQWLSESEGIPKSEWCYSSLAELRIDNLDPVPNYLDKTGYRLPTAKEWVTACRAGSNTVRFYGHDPQLLDHYCWGLFNARSHVQEVGQLMPNDYGMFDIYGNSQEICLEHESVEALIDRPDTTRPRLSYSIRGSSCRANEMTFVTDFQKAYIPSQSGRTDIGFRIARTIK